MKNLLSWIADYYYLIKGTVQGVMYRNSPQHYLGYVVEGKVPVILIPGILEKWGFLKDLGDKISLQGHPVYVLPRLGYNLFSIPSSAKMIHTFIDKVTKEHKEFKNAVIVAHSKGGLIGKYFLTHYNEHNLVTGMISIATPYSGSHMANNIPLTAIQELRQESKVIQNLMQSQEVNHRIISIIPEYDNHVWSEKGSYLEGAKNIHVPIHGHHKVVFDKGIQELILNIITSWTNN